jgi:hypothetical protein
MKWDEHWPNAIVLTAVLLGAMGPLSAQTPGTGAQAGKVSDPAGAVVANLPVSITNEATNLPRVATTTSEGLFRAPLLPPGNYSVIVASSGFEREVIHSIRVAASETTVVDVKFKIGATKTEVQVSGSNELAQTESAALGRVTDGATIVALPRRTAILLKYWPCRLARLSMFRMPERWVGIRKISR